MQSTYTSTHRRGLLALCALSSALIMAGCATQGGAADKAATEAQVLARAKAYWTLLKEGDHVAAWAYEAVSKDPAWTLQGYLKRGGITYEDVGVRGIRQLEGDKALVDVWTKFSVPAIRLRNQEAVAEDEWRRIDGQWYHVFRRSVAFSGS